MSTAAVAAPMDWESVIRSPCAGQWSGIAIPPPAAEVTDDETDGDEGDAGPPDAVPAGPAACNRAAARIRVMLRFRIKVHLTVYGPRTRPDNPGRSS